MIPQRCCSCNLATWYSRIVELWLALLSSSGKQIGAISMANDATAVISNSQIAGSVNRMDPENPQKIPGGIFLAGTNKLILREAALRIHTLVSTPTARHRLPFLAGSWVIIIPPWRCLRPLPLASVVSHSLIVWVPALWRLMTHKRQFRTVLSARIPRVWPSKWPKIQKLKSPTIHLLMSTRHYRHG